MRRKLIGVVVLVVAGLAAAAVRVVIEGRSAIADGDTALADKRPADAIAAWESAARWYLPLAPHVDAAYGRLRDFASTKNSIAAWRSIRSAALATRHLWQPHGDDLAEANQKIAELAATDGDRAPAGDQDPAAYTRWQAALLATDTRPSSGSAVLAIAGIASWLAGMGLLIRRSGGPKPGLRIPGAIAVFGALAWVLGLYTA